MLTAEVIGNLGRDAQTKQISDRSYVSFDVAHEQRNGENRETVWVSVLWYGNGGNLVQYLKRGAKVFVRGRLVPGIYTGRDGVARLSLSLMATEVQMCEFAKGEQPSPEYGQRRAPEPPANIPHQRPFSEEVQSAEDEEDLPF